MDNTLKKIQKIYSKERYFDQYGGSVVLFIIVTILLICFLCYSVAKSQAIPIANDWTNQRCNLSIIPIAGFIYHPDNTTAVDYTAENFDYCTQQILKNISSEAISPITYITYILTAIVDAIADALQAIRELFARILDFIGDMVENIVNRLMNIMIPIQNIIIGMQDVIGRTNGNMSTILYTVIGGYYSMQSLMGTIASFFLTILIDLIIAIVAVIYIPIIGEIVSAPLIIGATILAIFVGLLLMFMSTVLGINGTYQSPLQCFDKDTLVPMNDGTEKLISEIKTGDILFENNEVTAIVRVKTAGSIMYYLNDIFVSDTHIVNYHGKWVPVSKHPDAIICAEYTEPYLYCLNTSNKTIVINNTTFTDWDEIYGEDIQDIINKNPSIKSNKLDEIHKHLDGGFEESTMIQLYNGEYKKIKDILIDDKLVNGEQVYGIVEINGKNITEQFKFILGEKLVVEGGPNLVINDSKNSKLSTLNLSESTNKTKLVKNHDKLYHLLTDKKTFNIDKIQFCDYNASIDIFLEMKTKKYYL